MTKTVEEELKGFNNLVDVKYDFKEMRFSYELKHKAIQRRTNRFGYNVLITNTGIAASELLRITRKRSRGERPYSVMKRTFRGGHTFITTVPRVMVKTTFLCLGHNLFNLLSLERRWKIAYAI